MAENFKLSPKLVSVSLAAVSAILSLACALLLALAPDASLKFFGSIFHGIDLTKIAVSITFSGVATGLIAVIIISFITGYLFAVVFNYFQNILK